MYVINHNDIIGTSISPAECVNWVREAFLSKVEAKLPPKISLKPKNNVFFNTMPCYLPSIDRIAVKMVSRYPLNEPSLSSQLFLLDGSNGEYLAMMDGDWITAMRTGAVAALSISELESKRDNIYAFVGLGNTARATLLCLLDLHKEKMHRVRVLKYKNQAEGFIARFSNHLNVEFEIVENNDDLVKDADVIVSCVTAYDEIFAQDELYKEGVLLVPVHTRGFQNCDLFFDKIFADDRGHVQDFKYFNRFKYFNELSEVLNGSDMGRKNNSERIIAYNIGIALHDLYFASKIYDQIDTNNLKQLNIEVVKEKFWV